MYKILIKIVTKLDDKWNVYQVDGKDYIANTLDEIKETALRVLEEYGRSNVKIVEQKCGDDQYNVIDYIYDNQATGDYNNLTNKPSINGIELIGNLTSEELNLVSDTDLDNITTLIEEAGHKISVSINPFNYVMTLQLLDQNDEVLSTSTVDLPMESMIIDVLYDDETKRLTFFLQNGRTISVPLSDLVSGLQETLVSGENIKTLNNQSLLGSGNLDVNDYVNELSNADLTEIIG